jgi:hypothetical protein
MIHLQLNGSCNESACALQRSPDDREGSFLCVAGNQRGIFDGIPSAGSIVFLVVVLVLRGSSNTVLFSIDRSCQLVCVHFYIFLYVAWEIAPQLLLLQKAATTDPRYVSQGRLWQVDFPLRFL